MYPISGLFRTGRSQLREDEYNDLYIWAISWIHLVMVTERTLSWSLWSEVLYKVKMNNTYKELLRSFNKKNPEKGNPWKYETGKNIILFYERSLFHCRWHGCKSLLLHFLLAPNIQQKSNINIILIQLNKLKMKQF